MEAKSNETKLNEKIEDHNNNSSDGQKKKRKFHQKSRRGCKTCKRRRVKCDETRPICKKCQHLDLECSYLAESSGSGPETPGMAIPFMTSNVTTQLNPIPATEPLPQNNGNSFEPQTPPETAPQLNMVDLQLFFNFLTNVWPTMVDAGLANEQIWREDVPQLAFQYPYLMHCLLAISATYLCKVQKKHDLDHYITLHRGCALRLLREAVLNIHEDDTDALVASAIILIMDSLANAQPPRPGACGASEATDRIPGKENAETNDDLEEMAALPPLAWIYHVRGAATILTAVWPLSESSRFYDMISVDLNDLGNLNLVDQRANNGPDIKCFDEEIADLYPVEYGSPYLITLAYLDKLINQERYKKDFLSRIFAFPALLDTKFVQLFSAGDLNARRILRSYYKFLQSFTSEMKHRVWFLEGVANILPEDMDPFSQMIDSTVNRGEPSSVQMNLQDSDLLLPPMPITASFVDGFSISTERASYVSNTINDMLEKQNIDSEQIAAHRQSSDIPR